MFKKTTIKLLWPLLLFACVALPELVFAQANGLPACKGDYDRSTWTKCYGKRVNPNGDVYVGGFLNGVAHGKGTYTFASGGKYVGDYKNGRRDGQGTEYRANGSVKVSGTWAKGVLQKEAPKATASTTAEKTDQPESKLVEKQVPQPVTQVTDTGTQSAKSASAREVANDSAKAGNKLSSQQPLLEELLSKKWRIRANLDCQKGGGSYGVYDKTEGRYFVNNGLVDKAARAPEVDIQEVDHNKVVVLINYWATPLIEKALKVEKIYATQLELTITRDSHGKIMEAERAIVMDARAALEGVKKYTTETSDPTELLACDPGLDQALAETSGQERYNGNAKLRCDVNVNCNSQPDVLNKMKVRGNLGIKTNQSWGAPCLTEAAKVERMLGWMWKPDNASDGIKICNGG